MALEPDEDLTFPPLSHTLDPLRREVDSHPILEPRTQQRVNVRVRRTVRASVLMDREDALGAADGTAERLLDRVTQHPLGDGALQPAEALRGLVVDGQDEAEEDRAVQSTGVVAKRPPDRRLVATECAISLSDAEELAPLTSDQSLLTVRDVVDLRAHAGRVSVVPGFDEEHVSALP